MVDAEDSKSSDLTVIRVRFSAPAPSKFKGLATCWLTPFLLGIPIGQRFGQQIPFSGSLYFQSHKLTKKSILPSIFVSPSQNRDSYSAYPSPFVHARATHLDIQYRFPPVPSMSCKYFLDPERQNRLLHAFHRVCEHDNYGGPE